MPAVLFHIVMASTVAIVVRGIPNLPVLFDVAKQLVTDLTVNWFEYSKCCHLRRESAAVLCSGLMVIVFALVVVVVLKFVVDAKAEI